MSAKTDTEVIIGGEGFFPSGYERGGEPLKVGTFFKKKKVENNKKE